MNQSIPQSATIESLRRGHEPIPENLPVTLEPARIAEIIGDELAGRGIPFQVIPGGFVIINTDGQGVGRIGNDGNIKIFPQFAFADDAETFVKIGRIVWRAVQAEQWRENHFKEAAARYAASQAAETAVHRLPALGLAETFEMLRDLDILAMAGGDVEQAIALKKLMDATSRQADEGTGGEQPDQGAAVPGQPEPANGEEAAVTGRRFAYVPNVGAWQRVGKHIRITTIINHSGEFFGRWHNFNGLIPFSHLSHETDQHTRGCLVRWEPSQPEPINLEIVCKGLDGVDLLQIVRVDDFLVKLGVAFPETRPDLLQAMQDVDYAALLPELKKNCDVWQSIAVPTHGQPHSLDLWIERQWAMNRQMGMAVPTPGEPQKPEKGSPLEDWFDYYHACKRRKVRYGLKELADDVNLAYGYVRQQHMLYKAENGIT